MLSTNHCIFLGLIILASCLGIPEDTPLLVDRIRYFLISFGYILFSVYMIKFFKNWYNWMILLCITSYSTYILAGSYRSSVINISILFVIFFIGLISFYFSSCKKPGTSLLDVLNGFYGEVRAALLKL